MVKRRENQTSIIFKNQPTDEQIEAFASAADGGPTSLGEEKNNPLNPTAIRDYKSIRVPFNQFEYSKLEEVARKTGRTKLNVIRWAILKLAEKS